MDDLILTNVHYANICKDETVPEGKQKLKLTYEGKSGFLKTKVVQEIYGDAREYIMGSTYNYETPAFLDPPEELLDRQQQMDEFLNPQKK